MSSGSCCSILHLILLSVFVASAVTAHYDICRFIRFWMNLKKQALGQLVDFESSHQTHYGSYRGWAVCQFIYCHDKRLLGQVCFYHHHHHHPNLFEQNRPE